jgi:YegS/Rv2252/BmrU family lipid kinase
VSFRLLVNPSAAGGRALRRLPAVVEELRRQGIEPEVVQTRSLEHAREEAQAVAGTAGTVAAMGGDGFVRPIAGALRDSPARLAVLPGGRGNDFARVLGIPRDPAGAARVAAGGRERLVDLGEVDGEPYLGIASLGIDSDVQHIANRAKLVQGSLVYLYGALRALSRWRGAEFTVTVDGAPHRYRGYAAAVANTGVFGGGMALLPMAEIDDGALDVLLTKGHAKGRYLRGLGQVFRGTHLDPRYTEVLRAQTVDIDSEPPYDVFADGDPVGRTPVRVSVRPRCLRVLVPA